MLTGTEVLRGAFELISTLHNAQPLSPMDGMNDGDSAVLLPDMKGKGPVVLAHFASAGRWRHSLAGADAGNSRRMVPLAIACTERGVIAPSHEVEESAAEEMAAIWAQYSISDDCGHKYRPCLVPVVADHIISMI